MSELIDPALMAFQGLFDFHRLLILSLGVILGLCIGVIPGIGGLVGMALLLPFTYSMDPATALAFLIGMWSVTPTSDTIPAVLLGVPGSAGSSATVMDGYPMARQGQAGRALGAAYTASVIGGLFGAVILGFSIPILRPFMLSFGTPELLALVILGLMLVAAVSQGQIIKGLVAASVGVIIASVGVESMTGELRWTYGSLYLWDGVPLVAVVLGLFAIPEMVDVAISRRAIAQGESGKRVTGQLQGMWDAFRNWKIVLNSSMLGSVLGAVPGLGGAAIDWIAYGSAAKLVKGGTKSFGTGDVRGVIASEAANNAKEGGALVPTIAFGIPGSATMAILLGAFVMHGIEPGPKLLSEDLEITYTMVWSLAIGNIVGVVICFLLVSQLAKIARIPAAILVPTVLSIIFIGAYQATRDISDLYVVLVFGVVGWMFKRFGWARPPLLLGIVLGGLVEQYLGISTRRYDYEWLLRPGVIAIFSLPVLFSIWGLWRFFRRNSGAAARKASEDTKAGLAKEDVVYVASRVDRIVVPGIWVGAVVFFCYALFSTVGWDRAAYLMPRTVAIFALVLITIMATSILIKMRNGVPVQPLRRSAASDALSAMDEMTVYRRLLPICLWILSIVAGTMLIGLPLTLWIFMFCYMAFQGGTGKVTALLISTGVFVFILTLFEGALNVPWPQSYLGDAMPELRRTLSGII